MHASFWNLEAAEELSDIQSVRRPRQILQTNYNAHSGCSIWKDTKILPWKLVGYYWVGCRIKGWPQENQPYLPHFLLFIHSQKQLSYWEPLKMPQMIKAVQNRLLLKWLMKNCRKISDIFHSLATL